MDKVTSIIARYNLGTGLWEGEQGTLLQLLIALLPLCLCLAFLLSRSIVPSLCVLAIGKLSDY